MPRRTWWKKINLISATLCYFSLMLSIITSINWNSQSANIKNVYIHREMKVLQLIFVVVCLYNFQNHYNSSTWAAMTVSVFMLKGFSLQSSLSFGEPQLASSMDFLFLRRDTKTGHHYRDKLPLCFVRWKYRKLVVSSSVQDDVTFLPSAKHYASVSNALLSLLLLHCTVTERVAGYSQQHHWFLNVKGKDSGN